MSATPLALLGAALLGGALFLWVRMLNAVALEGRRWIPLSMIGASILLAVATFTASPGLFAGILAGLCATLGAGFLFLAVLAPQSTQKPVVEVGRPIPEFAAPDENGQPFALSSLAGKPILLKFFRGHW
ncbi:MAG: redoxin domain-containing protein [bacterium]|nr:redoxin domain-containing protein [bacterium]MCP5065368.1 redoxin domain-containing protein [bacterium]